MISRKQGKRWGMYERVGRMRREERRKEREGKKKWRRKERDE